MSMIIAIHLAVAVIMAAVSLYFAWRSRDFLKVLAGAFFVSSGFILSLSRRCFGSFVRDGCVETPKISLGRSIVHFVLFLLCAYFGFMRKAKGPETIAQIGLRARR
jgi:hypothetical protein